MRWLPLVCPAPLKQCRVGPGDFTPSPSQIRAQQSHRHTARAILESCRPPPKPAGSSCFQLTHYGSSVDDPPPSLRGRYSASSLLRGDPPLDAASVLSLSWFTPLVAFPLATTPSFPRSLRSPLPGSAHLYAGCRSPVNRFRRNWSRDLLTTAVLTSLALYDARNGGSLWSSSWKSSDPGFSPWPFPSPLTTTSLRTQQRKVI